jgi:hypothetical protein
MPNNIWLIAAGAMSAAAALAHLAVIAGGPDWYRFFGAGEGMARAAERGLLIAPLITVAIASVLVIWAAYAFSGAGLIPRLPLLRVGLVTITAIYLLRGLWILPGLPLLGRSPSFIFWSSMIVLIVGATYAIGTWRAWETLGARRAELGG